MIKKEIKKKKGKKKKKEKRDLIITILQILSSQMFWHVTCSGISNVYMVIRITHVGLLLTLSIDVLI